MTRRYSIIVVENDEDEQFFLRQGFDEAGTFDILAQVGNGEGLFEWFWANPGKLPDLILTDLNMPGMNGMEILQELRAQEQYRHIPVVVMSTSSTPMTIEKSLQAGASEYLVKPDTFIEYGPFVQKLYDRIHASGLV